MLAVLDAGAGLCNDVCRCTQQQSTNLSISELPREFSDLQCQPGWVPRSRTQESAWQCTLMFSDPAVDLISIPEPPRGICSNWADQGYLLRDEPDMDELRMGKAVCSAISFL